MSDGLYSPHTAGALAPVVVRFGAAGQMVPTVRLEALAAGCGRDVHRLACDDWTAVLLGQRRAVWRDSPVRPPPKRPTPGAGRRRLAPTIGA